MQINWITVVGVVASICTSTCMLPQLIKLVKDKKATDISISMLVILFVGVSSWVVYGFLKNDWIIISANVFSFIVNFLLTFFTLKYKN